MLVQSWLQTATNYLITKGIATARLDALVLLEDVLMVDRAKILAEPDMEIKDGAVATLQKLLNRRARHEPLAYIRGKAEFYGRVFKVSPATLVPRPETETMIDLLKQLTGLPPQVRIADVGTGSGAVGITAALEMPVAQVDLLEVSTEAAEVAKLNVVLHTTTNPVIVSDLLTAAPHDYEVLLCNLPYVPDDYMINQAAEHEPVLALFAGKTGLDLYQRLFEQLRDFQKKPLFILTEAFPDQHAALTTIAGQSGYSLLRSQDFVQVFGL